MDNMVTMGFDEDIKENTKEETVIDFKEITNRPPYATWTVNGTEYKLKLTSQVICKLEDKYKRNLLMVMMDNEGLPPVSVMLTVAQAAMQKYHHGFSFGKVQDLYDAYVDDGGDQTKMMADVIMPLLAVSGFFTQTQTEAMAAAMKEIDSAL